MDQHHKTPSPSIQDRSRPALKIPCFRHLRHSDSHLHSPITPSPPIKKSPSSFLRSTFKINDLAALLDCKPGDLVNHRRHHTRRHRQRWSSTDFAYDPLSYSLNFEEEGVHTQSFMSRLPVTPTGGNKPEDATRLTVEK